MFGLATNLRDISTLIIIQAVVGRSDSVHWSRRLDCVAVAPLVCGLGTTHREQLAAGGSVFLLREGELDYGLEEIIEMYYRAHVGRLCK